MAQKFINSYLTNRYKSPWFNTSQNNSIEIPLNYMV